MEECVNMAIIDLESHRKVRDEVLEAIKKDLTFERRRTYILMMENEVLVDEINRLRKENKELVNAQENKNNPA